MIGWVLAVTGVGAAGIGLGAWIVARRVCPLVDRLVDLIDLMEADQARLQACREELATEMDPTTVPPEWGS